MTARTSTYLTTIAIDDMKTYELLKQDIKLDKSIGEYWVKRFRGPRANDGRRRSQRQSMCLKANATRFDVYILTR